MVKRIITSYLSKNSKYTVEQKKLLNAIDKAREDLKMAREYFNGVNDPRLVDYAIYMEEAAKAKYMYLLNEARKVGLKVYGESILHELSAG
ncbi:YaaL family protein [Clostridium sp. CX1]|uniref:YaaL family protein n=1 Tax=Clostridium tanneri TaxID=3037988 RepID=A0ABU4JXT3_9CLOT|nr:MULTISPECIES: YaaL family protein [unclassified Clostridium]MCT8978736.1 YaaL family protein [Clostridium sp. CX1]MDW8802965.1 YaaL family protein [Clostridium sp. A1-XYC3]